LRVSFISSESEPGALALGRTRDGNRTDGSMILSIDTIPMHMHHDLIVRRLCKEAAKAPTVLSSVTLTFL